MKLRIYEDKSGEWRWRLRAANGRTIADSGEGYKTKNGVVNAVERFWAAYDGTVMGQAIKDGLAAFKGTTP